MSHVQYNYANKWTYLNNSNFLNLRLLLKLILNVTLDLFNKIVIGSCDRWMALFISSRCLISLADLIPCFINSLAPILVLCLILSSVSCALVFVVSARERNATLHVVCMFNIVAIVKEFGLLENGLCWLDIRFIDDLSFIDPYILSSVHLYLSWSRVHESLDNFSIFSKQQILTWFAF